MRSRKNQVLCIVYQRLLGNGVAAPKEEDETAALLAEGRRRGDVVTEARISRMFPTPLAAIDALMDDLNR